jgi:hypothetical protein
MKVRTCTAFMTVALSVHVTRTSNNRNVALGSTPRHSQGYRKRRHDWYGGVFAYGAKQQNGLTSWGRNNHHGREEGNPNLSPNPNPYPNSWTYHKHNKWQRFVIDECEDAYCLLPTEAFVRVTIHASKRRATRVFATSKGNWTVTLCVCEVYVWWCRWCVRLTLTPEPRC